MNDKEYWHKIFEGRSPDDLETALNVLFEVIEQERNEIEEQINKLRFLQKGNEYFNKVRELVKK